MKFLIFFFFTLSINCYCIANQFLRKLQVGFDLKYVTSTKCVDLKNTTLITIHTNYPVKENNQVPNETYIEFPIYLINDEPQEIRLNCTLKYLPILNCYPTVNATSSVDVVKYSVGPVYGESVFENYTIWSENLTDAIHHKSGVVAPLQNGPITFNYAKEDKDEFTFSIDFDGKLNKDTPPTVKAPANNSEIILLPSFKFLTIKTTHLLAIIILKQAIFIKFYYIKRSIRNLILLDYKVHYINLIFSLIHHEFH